MSSSEQVNTLGFVAHSGVRASAVRKGMEAPRATCVSLETLDAECKKLGPRGRIARVDSMYEMVWESKAH